MFARNCGLVALIAVFWGISGIVFAPARGGAPPTNAATVDKKVLTIRAQCAKIDHNPKRFRIVQKLQKDTPQSPDELLAYFEGKELRKISISNHFESGETHHNFYYDQGRLIAARQTNWLYTAPSRKKAVIPQPSSRETVGIAGGTDGVVGGRVGRGGIQSASEIGGGFPEYDWLYFDGNRLIRHLGPNGHLVHQSEADQTITEKIWLDDSRKYVAQAMKKASVAPKSRARTK